MNTIDFSLSSDILLKIEKQLSSWKQLNVNSRLWDKDPSVWKENPEEQVEITNRLGWLTLPTTDRNELLALEKFAADVKDEFSFVFVLGMGGSSLAPEVFSKTFGSREGYPQLRIVDNTHPINVQSILDNYDLKKCIFLMASKSGGTAETNSFFYVFHDALSEFTSTPGMHFVALTDPNTSLGKLAREKQFRKVITTPAEVGGRYSALTPFGALPMAMIGMDVVRFYDEALKVQKECERYAPVDESLSAKLGITLGELALQGKDKVTFFVDDAISSFPQWVEQLVAESSGKEDIGILPIENEPLVSLDKYGDDRVFVLVSIENKENAWLAELEKSLREAKKELIVISLKNIYALGQEFYRWEYATAAACVVLKVNPFDQPNVQLAKSLANESLKTYKETGKLPEDIVAVNDSNIEVLGDVKAETVKEALDAYFAKLNKEDYIALMLFTPYGEDIEKSLSLLRKKLVNKFGVAVSGGYGPRFLHSTGQLHKGGKNNGLFVQLIDNALPDLEVPGQGYSFGTLITAQAQGDANALVNKDRRLLRLRVKGNIAEALDSLCNLI